MRALVTAIGLGANRPQDAVYPTSLKDGEGRKYNGENKYVMHFPEGQLPPAQGFWSLTMYDSSYFFVNNPLNRYSISARQNLKSNPDGSTDLYIQKDSPGADKESNWLPLLPAILSYVAVVLARRKRPLDYRRIVENTASEEGLMSRQWRAGPQQGTLPCRRRLPDLARTGPPAMSAVWSLSGGKRT